VRPHDGLGGEGVEHHESIESFKQGNRQDLIDKEEAELTILQEYLPQQMTRDEIIAEALFSSNPLSCLLDLPSASPIGFSPAVVVALSDDCRTQARIGVESKTSVGESQKHKGRSDEAISLFFTIRQYPSSTEKFDSPASFEKQCRLAEELMAEKIIPNFVHPLNSVIAQKRIT